jgi:predicted DNA-binding protein
MAEEKKTVDYTIRNVPKEADTTLSHLSALTGTPKSVLVRELVIATYTDPIRTFSMVSPLVDALDQVLGQHCGLPVVPEMMDSFYGTRWNHQLQKLLGIGTEDQLQKILIKNTPYLPLRADQVMAGRKSVLKGTSTWFALFVEVAFSDEEVIRQAWKSVYFAPTAERYYRYIEHINALRAMRQLAPCLSFGYEQSYPFGHIRLFKPDHYEYGAWHIDITLTPEAARELPDSAALNGLSFPVLKQRAFHSPLDSGYRCAAVDENGEYVPGFRFIEGRGEFDVYSSGINEEKNETTPEIVVAAVATQIHNWLAGRDDQNS